MNKETLDEAAHKWVFEKNGNKWSNNDDTAGDNYGSFIEGAKWEQKQNKNRYSEEEIINFIDWIGTYGYRCYSNGWANMFSKPMEPKQLFKQFKKK
jgi:hypothetical protein